VLFFHRLFSLLRLTVGFVPWAIVVKLCSVTRLGAVDPRVVFTYGMLCLLLYGKDCMRVFMILKGSLYNLPTERLYLLFLWNT
jgi:hypothetical protein